MRPLRQAEARIRPPGVYAEEAPGPNRQPPPRLAQGGRSGVRHREG